MPAGYGGGHLYRQCPVKFGDEKNVVSIRAKKVDDLPVDILIGDELQPLAFFKGIYDVRPKDFSRKSDGGANSFGRQSGMLGQDLIGRFPRGQFVQNQLHRDAGPRKCGFGYHDAGVGCN